MISLAGTEARTRVGFRAMPDYLSFISLKGQNRTSLSSNVLLQPPWNFPKECVRGQGAARWWHFVTLFLRWEEPREGSKTHAPLSAFVRNSPSPLEQVMPPFWAPCPASVKPGHWNQAQD